MHIFLRRIENDYTAQNGQNIRNHFQKKTNKFHIIQYTPFAISVRVEQNPNQKQSTLEKQQKNAIIHGTESKF